MSNRVRQDTINLNKEQMKKAEDENELWEVVNDITKPKTEASWKLKENGKVIEKEEKIANIFNNYFIGKIEHLKNNINKDYVKDTLEKLKKKSKNLKFKLKTVSEKKVRKVMMALRKKEEYRQKPKKPRTNST